VNRRAFITLLGGAVEETFSQRQGEAEENGAERNGDVASFPGLASRGGRVTGHFWRRRFHVGETRGKAAGA
jgi:hypothetical protein